MCVCVCACVCMHRHRAELNGASWLYSQPVTSEVWGRGVKPQDLTSYMEGNQVSPLPSVPPCSPLLATSPVPTPDTICQTAGRKGTRLLGIRPSP